MAIRDRIPPLARRITPSPVRAAHPVSRTPWWVRTFTTAGRPTVAVTVLTMCAPGEHHLAVLAGWDDRLAWGMAAVLAAYAGIAAAVASNRPHGAPGQRSAIAGAIVSLLLAMAAQPVSHAFVTGHLSAEPRTPLWLVIAVSCVPPLVLGHLLHLAATPVHRTTPTATEQPTETHQDTVTPSEQPETRAEQPHQAPATPDETTEQPTETHELPELPTEPTRFLSTREVADRYGVKPSTVGTWKDRGKIRPALVDPALGNLYDPETLPQLTAAA